MIRYRYAFTTAGLLVVDPVRPCCSNRFPKDFLPDDRRGLNPLHADDPARAAQPREAGWIVQQMDKKLKAFPEVERVFGKIGRADTSTDPAPLTMIETTVLLLQPKSKWRKGMTKDKLVAEMDQGGARRSATSTPGCSRSAARVMMQSTGHPDARRHQGQRSGGRRHRGHLAAGRAAAARACRAPSRCIAERISEGYYVDVQNDLERMAEHGVTVDEAMATVRYAIGGDNIVGVKQADNTVVPLERAVFAEYIDTLDKIKNTPVVTADGRSVPLGDDRGRVGAEDAGDDPERQRRSLAGYIYVDLQDVTGPDYVESAQQLLADEPDAARPATRSSGPDSIEYAAGGAGADAAHRAADARHHLRPAGRSRFSSTTESVLILLSVPFAMVGGVFLQWLLGYPMTTAVIVGYISLFAVAVQTGIIMVIFIREALDHQTPEASRTSMRWSTGSARAPAAEADDRGRHRAVAAAGDVRQSAPGMEIMKPIAAPSIGGMVSVEPARACS